MSQTILIITSCASSCHVCVHVYIYIYVYIIDKLIPSGYLTWPWKITMLLIGKPSISMGHLYHGYVSHSQRVTDFVSPPPAVHRPHVACWSRRPGIGHLGARVQWAQQKGNLEKKKHPLFMDIYGWFMVIHIDSLSGSCWWSIFALFMVDKKCSLLVLDYFQE